jgi:protein farnesyltransferase subunit beta
VPSVAEKDEAVWDDVDDTLLNRKALQEFILYAGQHPAGGLRDKPPKSPDAYHTLYSLAGLSATQHRVYCSPLRRKALKKNWKSSDDPKLDSIRKEAFVSSLCWTEEEGASKYVGGSANRVNATHPIFNLTISHTEALMGHFYGQVVPRRPIRAKAS